ncbi:MAG: 3-oxoadipate enol-lactonase [Vicinamibacterales bacterium]
MLTPASDGCRIAHQFDGPQGAPVLVLSHSLGSSMEMWRPQVARLAERLRLLRFDTRGHGSSDVPPGEYTLERLARDVLDLLDAHGIARAHFCGLSLGGMIGQWLGANAPDRIDRLLLANTSRFMGPPSNWENRIALVRRDGVAALADTLLDRWFTPPFRRDHADDVQAIRTTLLATSPDGYCGCCAAIRDMDLRPSADRITAPTLLITGSEDLSTPPSEAKALAGAIPAHPRIVTLAAAHLSNVEQAGAFSDAVVAFLEERR